MKNLLFSAVIIICLSLTLNVYARDESDSSVNTAGDTVRNASSSTRSVVRIKPMERKMPFDILIGKLSRIEAPGAAGEMATLYVKTLKGVGQSVSVDKNEIFINKGNRKADFVDLEAGQTLFIYYTERDGNKIASSIKVYEGLEPKARLAASGSGAREELPKQDIKYFFKGKVVNMKRPSTEGGMPELTVVNITGTEQIFTVDPASVEVKKGNKISDFDAIKVDDEVFIVYKKEDNRYIVSSFTVFESPVEGKRKTEVTKAS